MKTEYSGGMGVFDAKQKRDLVEDNSIWRTAGPDLVPEPKSCPKAIAQYPLIRNTRHRPLVDAVRSHLCYLGWKIEYLSYKGLFRYISPDGKLYVSLRQVCLDLLSATGEIGPEISQDEETLLASQGNNIASSPDDRQVSGPSLASEDTDSDSDSSPSKTDYYPEAVVYWYKHGIKKNRKCHSDMKSKARKHLFALGWLCTPLKRNTGVKMLRYTSPSGKNCNSLRTACKVCIDEGGVGEAIASTKNSFSSAETSIMLQSRKRRRTDNNSSQLGSHWLQIKANSHSEEDEDKDKHNEDVKRRGRKVIEIAKPQNRITVRPEVQVPGSWNLNPRTMLSWLIDNNVVMEMAKVQYLSLKKGRIGHDGIKCDCCIKVFTLGGFEVHAGSNDERPSANLILEDGRSLLECQQQILRDNKARSSYTKAKDNGYNLQGDESDMICSVCCYGGHLILCDLCPSSFHHSCLGLKDIPEDKWVCPSCCCRICGKSKIEDTDYSSGDEIVRTCDQCEHKFHMGCIRKSTGAVKSKKYSWFCSDTCENVSSSLNDLLGRPFPLGVDNLTWTLLKSMEEEHRDPHHSTDIEASVVENQSKLNVALELMHECFEPVKEVLTGKDLIEEVIFNRRSNLNRLNFQGFYTVLLEKNEEIISVATIRVYNKVAELPLIATRLQYRRHGITRIFLNEIERKLIEVRMERLILPAVPAVLETWTTKFGFSKMTDEERLQFLDYTFLHFQDTATCHKPLEKTPSAKFGVGVHRSNN